MAVALPTAPKTTVRTGFPWKSCWLIGSPPKVGKSKLVEGLGLSTGRKLLHIDVENSTEDLSGYIVGPRDSCYPITNLKQLRELVYSLRENCPYDVIALDTIDVVNQWCEEETITEIRTRGGGKTDLSDLQVMGDDRVGFGKDWAMARNKMADIVDSLKMTGKLVLLVCHTKVEKGNYSGVNLAVPSGLGIRIRGACQVIAYLMAIENKNGIERWLTFTPSDNTIAGSRYAELNGQTLVMRLLGKEKDGKGYVDWSPVFALFGQQVDGQPLATNPVK